MTKNVVSKVIPCPLIGGRYFARGATDIVAPSSPTNVQAVPRSTSIDLSWINGLDGQTGIQDALVEYRVNGTSTWTGITVPYIGPSAASSTYSIQGLTSSTPYDIRITNHDNAVPPNPSAPSALIIVTTTASDPSLEPGMVSLVGTSFSAAEGVQFGIGIVRTGAGVSSPAIEVDWAFSGFTEGTPSPANGTLAWASGENDVQTVQALAGLVTVNRVGALSIVNVRALTGTIQPTVGTAQATVTIQNVATGAKKWRPGHYFGSQNYTWADDRKRPQQLIEHSYVSAAGANVQGLKRFYYIPAFGDVSSWDFTKIFRDLEIMRAMGKSLMIAIGGANFGSGTDYASILPPGVYNSSSYGASPTAGKYGWWSANGKTECSIAWYRTAEMNFVIAFFQAMATAVNPANGLTLDQDPNVEQICFAELSLGADPGDSAFTATSRVDQYERLMDAMAIAWPKTVFMVNNNYAGSQAQSQRLTSYCPIDACALGGPDTYPNTLTWGQAAVLGVAGTGITGGGPPNFTGPDQRGIIAMQSDTQAPELFQSKYGPYTPSSHFDWVNAVLQQSHMVWTAIDLGATDPPIPAYPGKGINAGKNPGNWNSCLQVINGNPLTHIQVPTSLLSSGGSGGIAVDGQPFSFTSTLNLTANNPQKFLGGKNGPLDSGSNNQDFIGSGLDAGFSNSGPGAQYPRFITAHATVRKCSLDFDAAFFKASNPSNSGAFGIGYDTGGAIVESYICFHLTTTANPNLIANGSSALQNKLVRWHPINSIVDSDTPFVMTSHWKAPPNASYLSIQTVAGNTTHYYTDDGKNEYPNFNTGIKYFVEFWLKPSSGTNVSDASFRTRWRHTSTGVVVVDNTYTGFNTYTDATRMRWVELQSYFGNASPQPGTTGTANGTTTFEEPGDGRNSIEDYYLQYGVNAQAHVEAGNAATFAACTKFLIQPLTDHTGTNRTITVNKPDSSWTYLYDFDSSGTLVNSNGHPF